MPDERREPNVSTFYNKDTPGSLLRWLVSRQAANGPELLGASQTCSLEKLDQKIQVWLNLG